MILELESGSNLRNFLTFQSLTVLRSNFENVLQIYSNAHDNKLSSRMESLLKALGKWYEEVDKLISLSYILAEYIRVLP